MKRANVRIRGNVQMAGFRAFIKNVADSLNLTGFAENVGDGSVKVVCEGEEEAIEGLINSVKQNPPSFVQVEEVNVAYEEYKGEFSGFERRGTDVPGEEGAGAGESEMLTLMRSIDKKGEVAIGILSSMNETLMSVKEDTKMIPSIKENTEKMLGKQDLTLEKQDSMLEKQDRMLEKQDRMLEKQDSMLEKQDRTIEVLGDVKKDTSAMLGKQDDTIGAIRGVSEKIDGGKEEIVTEISSLRGDLKSYMENKFARIEQEIEGIKVKIGMV